MNMKGTTDFVILKGEKLSATERMCDCIIFHGKSEVSTSLVELKGKTLRASQVIQKLNNGGKWAKKILEQDGLQVGRVTAVVLAKRFHIHEYQVLRTSQILIGSTRYRIATRPCGTCLKDIRPAPTRRHRRKS